MSGNRCTFSFFAMENALHLIFIILFTFLRKNNFKIITSKDSKKKVLIPWVVQLFHHSFSLIEMDTTANTMSATSSRRGSSPEPTAVDAAKAATEGHDAVAPEHRSDEGKAVATPAALFSSPSSPTEEAGSSAATGVVTSSVGEEGDENSGNAGQKADPTADTAAAATVEEKEQAESQPEVKKEDEEESTSAAGRENTVDAAPSASPIRRPSDGNKAESLAQPSATAANDDDNTNNNVSTAANVDVSIVPFGSRLLGAILAGDVVLFEETIADYRDIKGVEAILPSSSYDDSPTRRNRPAPKNKKRNSSPRPVDEASQELLSFALDRRDISATALFWAGYAGHSIIIGHIQRAYEAVFREQCKLAAKQLMDYQKDLAAISLLVRNGTPAAVINEHRGETALHRLVRRTKPNASLIHELLKTYRKYTPYPEEEDDAGADGEGKDEEEEEDDDVDAFNNDGFSALHIVAMYSKGIDGRSAAQVLLSHGADILCPSAKGGNARTLAQNPHVRSVLGYRNCPSPAVDAQSKKVIDSAKSIFDLPPLPPLEMEQLSASTAAESRLNPQSATEEEKSQQMRAVKRLDKEGVEAMVRRLYDHTLQLQEEKSAARRQALEPMESRRLTQEEQEAVADRLCNESMEEKETKREELMAKYLEEREPNPLDEEQQMESANRLCNQSMEQKRARLQELDEKYWADDYAPKKIITTDALKACANRLHDESTAHTRTKFDKLATQYLKRTKGEFMEGRVLTAEERAESRSRLTGGR